jgi:hypothetical protein
MCVSAHVLRAAVSYMPSAVFLDAPNVPLRDRQITLVNDLVQESRKVLHWCVARERFRNNVLLAYTKQMAYLLCTMKNENSSLRHQLELLVSNIGAPADVSALGTCCV